MKVLWVTNSIMPELSIAMGQTPSVYGGWQFGLSRDLASNGVSLVIVGARTNSGPFYHKQGNIEYYLLKTDKPTMHYDSGLEEQWRKIIEDSKPDLVHIHGSEHAHGLALVRAFPNMKFVLSIQGLISVYARYYTAGMTRGEISKSLTIRDFFKGDGILAGKRKFISRGNKVEKQYFKAIDHIIGRTDWDRHHALSLNKNCTYHFCNESLRDTFYNAPKWDIEKKEEFSIFLSQAGYPIKGMHQVLKAVSLIKDEFPKIKIKFAGGNILKEGVGASTKLKLEGYGKYLKGLIAEFGLEDNVEYLGLLSEEAMCRQYLKSHIFICPSSIENSPNSLGEAQILGVPTISSYVGGTPNMIVHNHTGLLYRFEEVEMLAQYIKLIFNDTKKTKEISKAGIEAALKRHSRETNLSNTISIYKTILDS